MANLSEVLAQEIEQLQGYLEAGQERLKSLKSIQSKLGDSSYSEGSSEYVTDFSGQLPPYVEIELDGQRFLASRHQVALYEKAQALQKENPSLSFSEAVLKASRGY